MMNVFTFVALVLLVILAGYLGYQVAGRSDILTELRIAKAVNEEWERRYKELENKNGPLETKIQELTEENERLKIMLQHAEEICGQEQAARKEAQTQVQQLKATLLKLKDEKAEQDRLLAQYQIQIQQLQQQGDSSQAHIGPDLQETRAEAPLEEATHLNTSETPRPEGIVKWPLVVVFLAAGAAAGSTVGSLRRGSGAGNWARPRDMLELSGETVSTHVPLLTSPGLLPAVAGDSETGEEAVWVWVPRGQAGHYPIWRSGHQGPQDRSAAFLASSRVQVLMTRQQALRFSRSRKIERS